MTLSKKLAQQQQLKSRNNARFGSHPEAVDESASSRPLSQPSTIQSGLEKLRRRFNIPQLSEDQARTNAFYQRRDTPAGVLDGDDRDAFLRHVSHSSFGLDDPQEAASIRRLIQLLCTHGETPNPRSVVFLDTETTGLSGGSGTVAFLVGVGRWSGSGFTVAQHLMRDYNEERAMLLGLQENLAGAQVLVTFNGKAFDIPLLQSRFVLTRQRWP